MVWAEITRPKYQRDGLRYASDTSEGGVGGAAHTGAGVLRRDARDQHARGGQCRFLHCPDRLSVAPAAQKNLPPYKSDRRMRIAWYWRQPIARPASSPIEDRSG